MDYHAFDKLSYGLYIVSSEAGGKAAGCIVNTLGQVTVSPVQVAVTINKENQTTRTILESGKFSATVLAESASMELIGRVRASSAAGMWTSSRALPGRGI